MLDRNAVPDEVGPDEEGTRDMSKTNRVSTVVDNGSVCASACVMVWGAGAKKAPGMTGRLGVHGASFGDNTDASQGTILMARILADQKAPATVIATVAVTSGKDMHWLGIADAKAWGAILFDKDGKAI
jgi:hypothetical protein